jgi:hypothetical protein
MRCHAKAGIGWQAGQGLPRAVKQPGKTVGVIAEPQLAAVQRAAIAATLLVMHGQQRQADPGLFGGGGDPGGKFSQIVIGLPAGCVVQIVKLHIRAKACFQHFHLHICGNGLHLIGGDAVKKPIHELPPAPETVALRRAAPFGQARHRTLKGMGMGVCGRMDNHLAPQGLRRGRAAFDAGKPAIRTDVQRHILRPAVGQKHLPCPENDRILGTVICHITTRLTYYVCS